MCWWASRFPISRHKRKKPLKGQTTVNASNKGALGQFFLGEGKDSRITILNEIILSAYLSIKKQLYWNNIEKWPLRNNFLGTPSG